MVFFIIPLSDTRPITSNTYITFHHTQPIKCVGELYLISTF